MVVKRGGWWSEMLLPRLETEARRSGPGEGGQGRGLVGTCHLLKKRSATEPNSDDIRRSSYGNRHGLRLKTASQNIYT